MVVQVTAVAVPTGTQRSVSDFADLVRSARWAAPAGGLSLGVLGLAAWWLSAGWLFVAAVALPVALAARIDISSQRLPDQLVLLALVPTAAATVAESFSESLAESLAAGFAGGVLEPVGAVALGMVAMGCAPFVTHAVAPHALGFGDVKLSIVLGAALGTWAPVLGVVALATASLIAVTESLVRRRAAIAFGPALVVGFVVTALFSSPIIARLGGTPLGWLRW